MFTLPFTSEQLSDLTGKTIVVCRNAIGQSDYIRVSEKTITAPGVFRGGQIRVEDGALCIFDTDGIWAKFNAVEYNGASTYMRGRFMRQFDKNDANLQQATLHIKKKFSSDNFGICISTCQNYSEFTMPKLLKSLAMAKIPAERIVAVMGGHGIDSEDEAGNIKLLTRIADEHGFNGLMGTTDKYPYWLLLDDTTEVEADIVERVMGLDVGLDPDLIRASKDTWIGLYSTSFINRVKERFSSGVGNAVMNGIRTCLTVEGEETESAPRDIYGKGVRRSTRNMPIGIQKYDAKTLARMP